MAEAISTAVQEYIQSQIAKATAQNDEKIAEAIAQNNENWEAVLNGTVQGLQSSISGNSRDMDVAWLVICGALVFFMQAGFAMLEAGIVHKRNVTNILFKVRHAKPSHSHVNHYKSTDLER